MSRARASAWRVLDALDQGDKRHAVELLLNIVTDGPPRRALPRCRVCGQRAWPGDARGHIASMHDIVATEWPPGDYPKPSPEIVEEFGRMGIDISAWAGT